MSDFIFSAAPLAQFVAESALQGIYSSTRPEVEFISGNWGCLAYTPNLYHGFKPLQTEQHILLVIGGPVLTFTDNGFLAEPDSDKGSQALYQRWLSGDLQWDTDLSGPFVVVIVDKQQQTLSCITDLMMFIPVYQYHKPEQLLLSTHVDILAQCSGQRTQFDLVSVADFVLNDVITYPYTMYSAIRQCAPAAQQLYRLQQSIKCDVRPYWQPQENNPYHDIDAAAAALRAGLRHYVSHVVQTSDKVAQFISGGEDSRALSGLLADYGGRDAFVFLDSLNREGEIAQQVAAAYGSSFNLKLRKAGYYLDILPAASKLIGAGHQYMHAHTLGFYQDCKLAQYQAVFGGYLADSLLKAPYANKKGGSRKFPFIPERVVPGESRTTATKHAFFNAKVLQQLDARRLAHMQRIQQIRPQSAHEWFVLWPSTMRVALPNLYCNRRLFRSYEPFMCQQVVKIAAAVPADWKLNRRLFHRGCKPFLRKSKWILHADGRLPYWSWWQNMPVQLLIWSWRHLAKKLGLVRGNQDSWTDLQSLASTPQWLQLERQTQASLGYVQALINTEGSTVPTLELFSRSKKINLFQVLYFIEKSHL
ncbi:asparagine synthase-related protein [Arsukibacterium ikkense]|uniref:asparagine synthase-related protein n=1 Tax=Arsukibacterium ikkense TaxID=336831 RepID=UPI00069B0433|nr:asparagine synthase-related protein [Arsukibacterium ikkense]